MFVSTALCIFISFGLLSGMNATILDNLNYFNVSNCLTVFAGKIYLVNLKDNVDILLKPRQNFDASSCSTNRASVSAKFTSNSTSINALDLGLVFSLHRGYWKSYESTVNLTCPSNPTSCQPFSGNKLTIDWASAPKGTGYKCVTPPLAYITANGVRTMWAVKFNWLQIQAFGNTNGVFGNDVSDCVGFFSIPIWSTLSISLLLVIILAYGLQMLASIKSNELFDDPRGKMVQLGANK